MNHTTKCPRAEARQHQEKDPRQCHFLISNVPRNSQRAQSTLSTFPNHRCAILGLWRTPFLSKFVLGVGYAAETNLIAVVRVYTTFGSWQPWRIDSQLRCMQARRQLVVCGHFQPVYPIPSMRIDRVTRGNWTQRYGKDGYSLFGFNKCMQQHCPEARSAGRALRTLPPTWIPSLAAPFSTASRLCRRDPHWMSHTAKRCKCEREQPAWIIMFLVVVMACRAPVWM